MKKLLFPVFMAALALCFTTHLSYGMVDEDLSILIEACKRNIFL